MDSQAILKSHIASLFPLGENELEALCSNWTKVEYKRKTILTAAGEKEDYLYFVLEGIQRAFMVDDAGREATVVFTYPPSFSGVADSLLTQTPSRFFFETLTSSVLLRIPGERLFRLMEEFPQIQSFILKATAMSLHGVLVRQTELQLMNAETRFKTLLTRSPHLLQLVPHKYIASYLGVDATNFSKMMGSIRI
jgi:CRP-like cAMP-binding protein